jgi:hypothetical protein
MISISRAPIWGDEFRVPPDDRPGQSGCGRSVTQAAYWLRAVTMWCAASWPETAAVSMPPRAPT